MFNKEGIPFFIIMIPFLSIILGALFTMSYYLKLSNENFQVDLKEYKEVYTLQKTYDIKKLDEIIKNKIIIHEEREKKYQYFIIILTSCILVFMFFFTLLMVNIINDIVKKYMSKVQNKEKKLQNLNETLSSKVAVGIEEGKKKDRAMLQQSKLARMGSMISMIAHQWRQPLSELSGVLMELEMSTISKKVNNKQILDSISRSNHTINFMSNTIDDFRNFYRPDKKKEYFNISDACQNAFNIINATLNNLGIDLILDIQEDKKIKGYPTEYAQVILNIISNAKDILIERKIDEPKIYVSIDKNEYSSIVIIRDNAKGIDEKSLDLIFDPYYSTKDSAKGTGLGLYISKLIIEKNMTGELSVENDDEGAVFKIVVVG
ncbi:histidine kinase [Arcobacter sp. 31_11_sub10_T18]|nr:histidine kinase [Arcobacter sp. 31_11_sub10_T18]